MRRLSFWNFNVCNERHTCHWNKLVLINSRILSLTINCNKNIWQTKFGEKNASSFAKRVKHTCFESEARLKEHHRHVEYLSRMRAEIYWRREANCSTHVPDSVMQTYSIHPVRRI